MCMYACVCVSVAYRYVVPNNRDLYKNITLYPFQE